MNIQVPKTAFNVVQKLLTDSQIVCNKIKKDKLLYIINVLFTHGFFNNDEESNGNVALSSTKLKELLGSNYTHHLRFLLENEIIYLQRNYLKGSSCNQYAIAPALIDEPIWHTMTDFTFSKKIRKQRKIKEKSKNEYPYLVKWFDGLKMNIPLAKNLFTAKQNELKIKMQRKEQINSCDSLHKESSKINYLAYIINSYEKKDFYFFVDSSGKRFHTLLTSTNKELRQCLTYNGQRLVSIDLKNSQPYLLLVLANPAFLNSDLFLFISRGIYRNNKRILSIMLNKSAEMQNSKGFQRYKKLTTSGRLYESFLTTDEHSGKQLNDSKNRRDDIKKDVLIAFYSKQGTRSGGVKKIFRRKFPQVYQFINLVKKDNYKALALLLQRIESHIMLDHVCARITSEKPDLPIFTIHDSVVTTEGNQEYVKQVIADEMFRFVGEFPMLSIEHWGDPVADLSKELVPIYLE